ncbi:MAG: ATP-dependent Clp protease adaptor ClpS, partial [Desulfuromonadales bacterium]|nr:ATP-dependent Clp protease adaptor ClpS [Desulfuromonadales bacterium]NIS39647.1 ATP-dependent Clp protease adaptor ClpS [Desulfuromonadales bacterium]
SEARPRSKTSLPPLHKVLLHNDDYTSMEFVVAILETVFHKTPAEANRIMLSVHVQGVGVAGVYPFEVAE